MGRLKTRPRCYICKRKVVKDPSSNFWEAFFCSQKCAAAAAGSIITAGEQPWWDPKRVCWVGGGGDFAGEPE